MLGDGIHATTRQLNALVGQKKRIFGQSDDETLASLFCTTVVLRR
ncbi:hypothetical protein LSPH24S_00623 [Lysinibacillus sphaericus]